MRIAFKEWSVIVDALGRGEQILLLRKGGIAEGRRGFQVDHRRFFLFPTQFHQQRESVIDSARNRFDPLDPGDSAVDQVRIEFLAEVVAAHRLISETGIDRLRGQHIWRDELLKERFEWGKEKGVTALALRVHRLPKAKRLPMRAGYGGCRSWVELEEDLGDEAAQPVLSRMEFEGKLEQFRSALSDFEGVTKLPA